MNDICPNGYICINHFNAIMLLIVIISGMYIYSNENYKKLFSNYQQLQQTKDEIQSQVKNQLEAQDESYILESKAHNIRVVSDPLYPPMKRGIPINIETRGSGGDFQQLGVLSKDTISNEEDSPGNNTDSVILPLYGKPTYRGSNRYLYYTETDKYNPVKVPISNKDRDCTDDQGCDEIYDGDQVTIPSYNGVFNVKIYKFNKPRYIPYI
tara:strand:+ start:852 stop:1481 length:630 start_codon:yes stop_codon:yes gene_type:complete